MRININVNGKRVPVEFGWAPTSDDIIRATHLLRSGSGSNPTRQLKTRAEDPLAWDRAEEHVRQQAQSQRLLNIATGKEARGVRSTQSDKSSSKNTGPSATSPRLLSTIKSVDDSVEEINRKFPAGSVAYAMRHMDQIYAGNKRFAAKRSEVESRIKRKIRESREIGAVVNTELIEKWATDALNGRNDRPSADVIQQIKNFGRGHLTVTPKPQTKSSGQTLGDVVTNLSQSAKQKQEKAPIVDFFGNKLKSYNPYAVFDNLMFTPEQFDSALAGQTDVVWLKPNVRYQGRQYMELEDALRMVSKKTGIPANQFRSTRGRTVQPRKPPLFFGNVLKSSTPEQVFEKLDFTEEEFDRALAGIGDVVRLKPNRRHKGRNYIELKDAQQMVSNRTGIPGHRFRSTLDPSTVAEKRDVDAYNGYETAGVGRTVGFDKGQKNDQVLRGAARAEHLHRHEYDEHGKKRTQSSRMRQDINGLRDQWKKKLAVSNPNSPSSVDTVLDFFSGFLVESVTGVPSWFADLQTIGDPEENARTKAGASFNVVYQWLLSPASGPAGKAATGAAMKVLDPLVKAAARQGKRAPEALRALSNAIKGSDAGEAVKVATEGLGLKAEEARRVVSALRTYAEGLRAPKNTMNFGPEGASGTKKAATSSRTPAQRTLQEVGKHLNAYAKAQPFAVGQNLAKEGLDSIKKHQAEAKKKAKAEREEKERARRMRSLIESDRKSSAESKRIVYTRKDLDASLRRLLRN